MVLLGLMIEGQGFSLEGPLVLMAKFGVIVRRSLFDKDAKVDNFYRMARLTIEIEPEQHRQIKTLATFSGMTIKEFILSKTLGPPGVPGDTTDRLMGSAKNAARLREAIATPDSGHRVFESVEDLKNALGI